MNASSIPSTTPNDSARPRWISVSIFALAVFAMVTGLYMQDFGQRAEPRTKPVVNLPQNLERPIQHIAFHRLRPVRLDLNSTWLEYPAEVMELDGAPVRLHGYLEPGGASKLDDHFLLTVRHQGNCPLDQIIYVDPSNQLRAQLQAVDAPFLLIGQPVAITGTLHLASPKGQQRGHRAGFYYTIQNATAEFLPRNDLRNLMDAAKSR